MEKSIQQKGFHWHFLMVVGAGETQSRKHTYLVCVGPCTHICVCVCC